MNLSNTMEDAQEFLTKYRETLEKLIKVQEDLSIEKERENSLAYKLKIIDEQLSEELSIISSKENETKEIERKEISIYYAHMEAYSQLNNRLLHRYDFQLYCEKYEKEVQLCEAFIQDLHVRIHTEQCRLCGVTLKVCPFCKL